MTQKREVYKCNFCGNIVEVLHPGVGELVCCGQPMEKMNEKSQEEGLTEKHLPVVETDGQKITVKIGSVPHPMEEKHFIEWIEVETADECLRQFLKPGGKPEAEFAISATDFEVRAYCNVHGLWKK
jgi:superoxide reductase